MRKYIKTNCTIAEFMGFVFYDDKGKYYHIEDGYYLCKPKKLKYHESWDWLMPVVEKIERLRKDAAPHDVDFDMLKEDINDALSEGRLDYTYQNIVNFIKWFNEKK